MPVFSLQTKNRGVPRWSRPKQSERRVQIRLPGECLTDVERAKAALEARLGAALSFSAFLIMAAEATEKVMKRDADWIPKLFEPDKTV